jgi:hypothetical protein
LSKKDESYTEDTIDLRTLFRLFLKRKWWFIATVILVAVLGFLYILRTPVLYEAKFKFSLKDDYFQDEYLKYSESQDDLTNSQDVFIEAEEVPLILKTDMIFSALEEIPEIDDYEIYINSSLIKIDLEDDSSVFSLKVENYDKELAKKIGLKLIESLGEQIKNQDIEIFNNTIEMIEEDIRVLEEENIYFKHEISEIEDEVSNLYAELDSSRDTKTEYEIIKKNDEILLYEEKIIGNDDKIREMGSLYQEFTDKRDKVVNRVELLTGEPSIDVEDNRTINSVIVILLSILTGIVVILGVNYIYKLKREKS